jgi:hypothetical protein
VEGKSESVSTEIARPPAPTGVTVAPLSSISVKVSWDAVPRAEMYSVFQRETTTYVISYSVIASTLETTYTVTGLAKPSTSYSFYITATNRAGTSAGLTIVSAYTQPIPLIKEEWLIGSIMPGNNTFTYYSFPVNGGTYYIQWGNADHTDQISPNIGFSAYWKNENSMTGLSSITPYPPSANDGFVTSQAIVAQSSGFVILRFYNRTGYNVGVSIRYYERIKGLVYVA